MKKHTRLPRFNKKKSSRQPTQLTTQDDFYREGFQLEDQANRWLISDVKKSLRLYQQAMIMYQNGLTAPGAATNITYDIRYNITRLYLQIYNDYLANNGFINILQYVDLTDIPNIDQLFKPLSEIVMQMEKIGQDYNGVQGLDTWDLQSNLVIAYLTILENQDQLALDGVEILNLNDKFQNISINLLLHQLNEINNEANFSTNESTDNLDDGFVKDTINEQFQGKDGSGIKINLNDKYNQQNEQNELVNVSDQITNDSIFELIINMLKFKQNLIELVIENRLKENELNLAQVNHLEDHINGSLNQINDIINSHPILTPILQTEEFQITTHTINCDKLIMTQHFDLLQETIISNGNINYELANIDILKFAQNCIQENNLELRWTISTLLSKKLTEVRNQLSIRRQTILKSLDKEMLSKTVYQLCNIYLESSENEIFRFQIKRLQDPTNTKTQDLLLKNAKTLLNNGANIAKNPCGMQEHINDKLVRNYIFNEINQAILDQNDLFQNK